ncbi:hypothetical protein KC333_g6755 [Hortaea werneckii]|nr:hypothetical protein KC333_g6755 [Hortaea werneckii]KAI7310530.1 hypothetical protein KC326_g6658 [Hortaea werneckii]
MKKVSEAGVEVASTKSAPEATASQAKADMAQMGETLREAHQACSRMEQEKERLTRDFRDIKKIADYKYTVIETERGRVQEYQNALTDVTTALWLQAGTANDSPAAVTDRIKTRIGTQNQLNAAAATAIHELKDKVESLALQRDRLAEFLNERLSTCVQALSLCDRMIAYSERGMSRQAVASWESLQDSSEEVE